MPKVRQGLGPRGTPDRPLFGVLGRSLLDLSFWGGSLHQLSMWNLTESSDFFFTRGCLCTKCNPLRRYGTVMICENSVRLKVKQWRKNDTKRSAWIECNLNELLCVFKWWTPFSWKKLVFKLFNTHVALNCNNRTWG